MRRAIVVSDVHLDSRGPTAHLGQKNLLPQLIAHLEKSTDTELVLAGDVFDYLEAPEYSGWDRTLTADRMRAILAAHPCFVQNMKSFVSKLGNRVSLLCGNHDPEVALDEVRELFATAIGLQPGQLDKEELLQWQAPEAPLFGRSLFEGAAWVVHGDRWDPPNRIDRSTLLQQPAQLGLPSGSRLVFDVLRRIRETHPWIYYLKVSTGTVLLLLALVAPRIFLEHLSGNGALVSRLLFDALRVTCQGKRLGSGQEQRAAMSPENALIADLAQCIGEDINQEFPTEQARNDLLEALQPVLENSLRHSSPLSTASIKLSHSPKLIAFLQAQLRPAEWSPSSSIEAPCWQIQLADSDLVGNRFTELPQKVSTLIAGHTHGPRWREANGHRYVNSGTWIPIGYLRGNVLQSAIQLLNRTAAMKENADAWVIEVPATYVEVMENGRVTLYRLNERGEELKVCQSGV